jgi:hemerythrin
MSTPAGQAAAAENQQTLDNEHLVQLGLIDAVIEALRGGEPAASVCSLLGQYVDFTELHFMSEQLVMRQQAYPLYQEHVADHTWLVEQLHELHEACGASAAAFTIEQIQRYKGRMLAHIRNRDAALHAYLAGLGDAPA